MAFADRPSVADFYEREILPALYERLNGAFPEFGWTTRSARLAPHNQQFTHSSFGVRADRIVCHDEAPRGFLTTNEAPPEAEHENYSCADGSVQETRFSARSTAHRRGPPGR